MSNAATSYVHYATGPPFHGRLWSILWKHWQCTPLSHPGCQYELHFLMFALLSAPACGALAVVLQAALLVCCVPLQHTNSLNQSTCSHDDSYTVLRLCCSCKARSCSAKPCHIEKDLPVALRAALSRHVIDLLMTDVYAPHVLVHGSALRFQFVNTDTRRDFHHTSCHASAQHENWFSLGSFLLECNK